MKDISKIISIVFLSFSILLLCYVFYRSQILYAGIRFDYYFKHYVIAFLFIIFSFISFFIPKKLKINITIVFVSILVGLYIVEGYLTVKNQGIDNKFEIYKNKTGKDYDKRSKIQIYQDLKNEYLEKYMPKPDADPHGGVDDFKHLDNSNDSKPGYKDGLDYH